MTTLMVVAIGSFVAGMGLGWPAALLILGLRWASKRSDRRDRKAEPLPSQDNTCPRCDGLGEIRQALDCGPRYRWTTCPDCDGFGFLDAGRIV